ncbi:MAG: restriction endonuclease [Cyanobacteriota bacterium]|jgi:hypothetical protein
MTSTDALDLILATYGDSFCEKVYSDENEDHDLLMGVFGITPELKRENRQYWGRELGKCWELLVNEICRSHPEYSPALKIGQDEPCDLVVNKYAIDTKYRIGSGDSGTLKKFKSYGGELRRQGYEPVFLILRSDNLPAAIQACKVGTWNVLVGEQSLEFIESISGFDIAGYLRQRKGAFPVSR